MEKNTMCDVCCEEDVSLFTCDACNFACCEVCNAQVYFESYSDSDIESPFFKMVSCMNCKKGFHLFDVFHSTLIAKRLQDATNEIVSNKFSSNDNIESITKASKFASIVKSINSGTFSVQEIVALRNTIVNDDNKGLDAATTPKQKKNTTLYGCPTVGCRIKLPYPLLRIKGTITCLSCKKDACSLCRECYSDDSHECDENVLKSLEDIESSTQPCPRCTTRILRTSGCDNMFCTYCKAKFSWRTGKLHDFGYKHELENHVIKRVYDDDEVYEDQQPSTNKSNDVRLVDIIGGCTFKRNGTLCELPIITEFARKVFIDIAQRWNYGSLLSYQNKLKSINDRYFDKKTIKSEKSWYTSLCKEVVMYKTYNYMTNYAMSVLKTIDVMNHIDVNESVIKNASELIKQRLIVIGNIVPGIPM